MAVSGGQTTATERRIAMPTERESNDIKKTMAYDLTRIIRSNPEKRDYTPEEIEEIIDAYIAGLTQK